MVCWFISKPGSTNNNNRFKLLPKNRKYEATLYKDDDDSHFWDNKESYKISKQFVDSDTKLTIKMGAGDAIYIKNISGFN